MEKKNANILKKIPELINPGRAILIFILIVLIIPFYESKRISIWTTQREGQKDTIFNSLLVSYVAEAEKIKAQTGLGDFFDAEQHFWLDFKKSPLVYEENIVPPPPPSIKDGESINGDVITDLPDGKEGSPSQKEDYSLLALGAPHRVLIIGDSFIAIGGGVGNPLERTLLGYKDLDVYRSGKVSSGLSRPDYFNWNLKAQELISQYSPNIVIVMLGSNDAQALTTPQGGVAVGYSSVGEEKWNSEYGGRVLALLDIFEQNNVTVFWVGLPIMKKEDFSNKMKNLNSIYEEEIKKYENAYYISIWDLLADEDGNYTAYLPDGEGRMKSARVSDGVHLQYFAGDLVAEEVISKMKEIMELEVK
jgi:lysophospholipase L1-like esterase